MFLAAQAGEPGTPPFFSDSGVLWRSFFEFFLAVSGSVSWMSSNGLFLSDDQKDEELSPMLVLDEVVSMQSSSSELMSTT
jgi:hypothetical protein